MTDKNSSSPVVWITTFVLAAVYLWAGMNKFETTTNSYWQVAFTLWGYPDWFRTSIGVLEMSAAVLLLYPKTASMGAITLACIMVGATATNLRHDSLLTAVFPAMFFVSLSALAYYRFPRKELPV
jgi:putative oxidoreductase